MKKKQLNGYCNLHKHNTKKQTAIQWLIDELKENGIDHLDLADEIIEEALQLEREQHKESWHKGFEWGNANCELNGEVQLPKFDEYYDNTFLTND